MRTSDGTELRTEDGEDIGQPWISIRLWHPCDHVVRLASDDIRPHVRRMVEGHGTHRSISTRSFRALVFHEASFPGRDWTGHAHFFVVAAARTSSTNLVVRGRRMTTTSASTLAYASDCGGRSDSGVQTSMPCRVTAMVWLAGLVQQAVGKRCHQRCSKQCALDQRQTQVIKPIMLGSCVVQHRTR